MSEVGIITDSAACVPEELIGKYGIEIAPMILINEGKAYRDRIDIASAEFYQSLSRDEILWTTSAPSPGSYLELFRKAADKFSQILVITMTPNLSHAYESARAGVDISREELSSLTIEVLDSGTAAGAQGLVVLAAARAANRGETLSRVIASTRSLMSKVGLIAFLDTLSYLAKGGRVPQVAAWASSLLNIKPIIEVLPLSRGVRSLQRVRTRPGAIRRLEEIVKERVGRKPVHCIVMHSNFIDEAEELKERMASELDCAEVYVTDFTPVMGVHTGPGLLGVAFYTDNENDMGDYHEENKCNR